MNVKHADRDVPSFRNDCSNFLIDFISSAFENKYQSMSVTVVLSLDKVYLRIKLLSPKDDVTRYSNQQIRIIDIYFR